MSIFGITVDLLFPLPGSTAVTPASANNATIAFADACAETTEDIGVLVSPSPDTLVVAIFGAYCFPTWLAKPDPICVTSADGSLHIIRFNGKPTAERWLCEIPYGRLCACYAQPAVAVAEHNRCRRFDGTIPTNDSTATATPSNQIASALPDLARLIGSSQLLHVKPVDGTSAISQHRIGIDRKVFIGAM